MKEDELVRVGIVGAGAIAQVSHFPAYHRMPGVKLTAVCDVDLAKARRVASRYNVPHVLESFEELARLDDVDVVDICLPNHLHAPATLAALEAGKDVHCERPFSRSSEEAAAMVRAARERDRVLMSGFNNRYREDAILLRRFIAEGEIGRIFYGKAGWLMQASTWSGAGWRKKKKYAGGGVLMDLGIQMLDMALWILGMPKVVTVSATANPRPSLDDMESTASAFLRLANDNVITLEVSWGLLMERDFAYVNLFGEKGVALLNPLRLHKEMHGSLVNVTPNLGATKNPYKLSYESEIRHFIDCVRTRARPDSSAEDALLILQLLEGLYRSATEGREVALP